MRSLIMVMVAAGAVAVTTPAFAQQGAELSIDEVMCVVPDAAATGTIIFPRSLGGDAVVQSVLTPDGNAKITCNGTLPGDAVLPERGTVLFDSESTDGGVCTILGEPTTDWHAVVAKSGRVTFSCFVNGN